MTDQPINQPEEYELMLELERLESLKEDLEELNLSTFSEVEIALTNTANPVIQEKRPLLLEVRDEMLDLEVESFAEIDEQIQLIHQELDQQDF